MKKFMEPEIEIVKFALLDVITTSDEDELYIYDDELGWK